MKLDNQIVWKTIFKIMELLNLNVILYKVKAHNNDP